jgi:hypothetical protein
LRSAAIAGARAGDRALRSRYPSLLTGTVNDGLGRRMSPSHANKQGRRYSYYITHERQCADLSQPVWRVPAHDLEQLVIDTVRGFLCDCSAIHSAIDGNAIAASLQQARIAAGSLGEGIAASQRDVLQNIVERIDLPDDYLDIVMRLSQLAPGLTMAHLPSTPVQRLRRGQTVKLILSGSEPSTRNRDRDSRQVALVAEAHLVRKAALEQRGSLAQIYALSTDMMRISYLAPDIVAAIMDGRQPTSLKRKTLMATSLSSDWTERRRQPGFT